MAPTTKPKPIPDAYRRVTPCLMVQGGVKALAFYAAVFGATERRRFPGPGGTVAHAEIQVVRQPCRRDPGWQQAAVTGDSDHGAAGGR